MVGRPVEYAGKATVVGAHDYAAEKVPGRAVVAAEELEILNEPS